jgi:hypothetical protein
MTAHRDHLPARFGLFRTPSVGLELRSVLASLPNDAAGLRRACEGVSDWSALLAAAQEHGVVDVVVAAADRAGVSPPSAALERAMQQKRLASVWQDVLHHALHAILGALQQGGIRAAALKGPVLAARLYDEHTARPSSDLDVLVEPASIDAACELLRPLGYTLEGGRAGRFFREHHHHVHVLHPTLPSLELHFEASRGFGTVLPAAPLLARATPCELPAWSDAYVLSPEDEFLYLAMHAASHRFQRLLWLFDLKLLALRHPDLRWDVLAARAKEYGLSAVLAFTCALLSEWLGAPRCGGAELARLGERRAHLAQHLSRLQRGHAVNAALGFLLSAVLCEDLAHAAAFSSRFVRVKVLHEAPLRAQALL